MNHKAILGYSMPDKAKALSDALAAGYSLSRNDGVPILINPYTEILTRISVDLGCHDQRTFGPEVQEMHVCGTPMCTAGHLVNLAGDAGWALKEKTSWEIAATLIHYASHPDYPCQNFDSIPQKYALAYIEEMAAREAAEGLK